MSIVRNISRTSVLVCLEVHDEAIQDCQHHRIAEPCGTLVCVCADWLGNVLVDTVSVDRLVQLLVVNLCHVGMCMDMCMGMCMDRRMGMCIDRCTDMCMDTCADMCIDMYIDTCKDMCIDMCTDMCMDMCIDMYMDRCMGTCIDMCIGMGIDMCIVDMCIDMGMGMCIDMCKIHFFTIILYQLVAIDVKDPDDAHDLFV